MTRDEQRGTFATPLLKLVGGVTNKADGTLRGSLEGAEIGTHWEVDLAPVNLTFDDDPAARPAVEMIVGNGFVLGVDVVAHPPADPSAIAAMFVAGIERTAEAIGRHPEIVETRHADVATALDLLVAPQGVRVICSPSLPGFDDALGKFRRDVLDDRREGSPRVSCPERWAGWGWPAEQVGELFHAFAAFYRSAPWRTLGDDEVLSIRIPNGRTWYASILGQAKETFGIALYGDARDLETLFARDDSIEGLGDLVGPVLSLSFNRFDELPRGMHREIRAAGWEVAAPTAHPVLMTLNTPGGGITEAQRGDLIAVFGAVPAFVAAKQRVFDDAVRADRYPPLMVWGDPATGTDVEYSGSWSALSELVWEPPERLAPACASGPGARPGARLGRGDKRIGQIAEEETRLKRFAAWLSNMPGRAGPRAREKEILRDVQTAAMFVSSVLGAEAVIAGVSELDLREFLYANYPLEARKNANHARTLASLSRFFDFLEADGIVCPWAWPILGDAEAVAARCESAPRDGVAEDGDDGWYMELALDLGVRLLKPFAKGDDGRPAESAGDESGLAREWLRWRDEVITGGETDPQQVFDRLVERQASSAGAD